MKCQKGLQYPGDLNEDNLNEDNPERGEERTNTWSSQETKLNKLGQGTSSNLSSWS